MKYESLLKKHSAPWFFEEMDGLFEAMYLVKDSHGEVLYQANSKELALFLVDLANGKVDVTS